MMVVFLREIDSFDPVMVSCREKWPELSKKSREIGMKQNIDADNALKKVCQPELTCVPLYVKRDEVGGKTLLPLFQTSCFWDFEGEAGK